MRKTIGTTKKPIPLLGYWLISTFCFGPPPKREAAVDHKRSGFFRNQRTLPHFTQTRVTADLLAQSRSRKVSHRVFNWAEPSANSAPLQCGQTTSFSAATYRPGLRLKDSENALAPRFSDEKKPVITYSLTFPPRRPVGTPPWSQRGPSLRIRRKRRTCIFPPCGRSNTSRKALCRDRGRDRAGTGDCSWTP
jgi:hypothetical protein